MPPTVRARMFAADVATPARSYAFQTAGAMSTSTALNATTQASVSSNVKPLRTAATQCKSEDSPEANEHEGGGLGDGFQNGLCTRIGVV